MGFESQYYEITLKYSVLGACERLKMKKRLFVNGILIIFDSI
jgi:hypothetical protein